MRTLLTIALVIGIGVYLGGVLDFSSFNKINEIKDELGSGSETTLTDTTGITSLGGLTAVTQTFANDTNVTISSSGSTHTVGWSGTLAAGRGGWGNDGTASTTRIGGLAVGGGGLQTSAGLTISAGRLLATTTATSTILGGLELFSVSASSGIQVTAGSINSISTATSTWSGGLSLTSVGLSAGLSITGGSITNTSVASSTFANGVNLTAGCFAIANVCVGGGGGSGTINSGTVNNIAYYSGATALNSANLTIDVANTRFGIGSTTPLAALSVAGQNGQFALAVSTSTLTATASAFIIDLNGKVGIGGTTSPNHALTITGAGYAKERSSDAAAAVTVDWSLANQRKITVNAATTFTFVNGMDGGAYRLVACQDATGARTLIWPASSTLQWRNSDSPPAATTRPNHCDIFSFIGTTATSGFKYFGNSSVGY